MNNKPVDVICSNELIIYPSRKIAINFYYECMCASEGAEREVYTKIFTRLVSTRDKMVSDADYYETPKINIIQKFVGDHCVVTKKLPTKISYDEYIKQQKIKEASKVK